VTFLHLAMMTFGAQQSNTNTHKHNYTNAHDESY